MLLKVFSVNVANQFYIKSIDSSNGEFVVEVGYPHEGYTIQTTLLYTIQTTLLNSKLNGKSYIISNDNLIIVQLYFDNKIASGLCILFDGLDYYYYYYYLHSIWIMTIDKEGKQNMMKMEI